MTKPRRNIRIILTLLLLTACERVIEPTFASNDRWAEVPVGVSTSEGFDWPSELTSAIRLWNDNAGCPIFEQDPNGPIAVSIGEDSPAYPERRGWVEVYAAGGTITRAQIGLHGVSDTRTAYLALAHELGGALLLDHDSTPSSIMHPNIAGRSHGIVLVARKDAKAVAARYCP